MSSPLAARTGLIVPLILAVVGCGAVAQGNGGDAGRGSDSRAPSQDAGSRHDAGSHDTGGSDGGTRADAGNLDATSDGADASPPRDHGEASTTYPAFTPFMPQVLYGGGAVLENAEIVTITWSGDANASTFEAFGDDIGTSDYWAETTSEYKVGPAHSGPLNHVRVTDAPIASWADTDIATWIVTRASSPGMYGWPAPNGNTLYALYISPETDVLYGGSSACGQGIGGYHDNVVVDGQDVAYAIVLQCQGGPGNQVTAAASHELIEAATDPHPQDITAWVGFDGEHLAWDIFQSFQDEVGDACEFYFDAYFDDTFSIVETLDAGADGGEAGTLFDAGSTSFAVQRTWSNLNAAAGHAPCRPTDYSVYFNVTPLQLDSTVSVLNTSGLGGPATLQGQGYRIANGTTRTFPVGFYSDGPTTGPWTISASEGNPLMGGSQTSHLTISIDRTSGQNGDIAYVTVTVNAVDTTMNGELVTIESQLTGFHRTFMPILISNE